MAFNSMQQERALNEPIALATGERALFAPGDSVKVGHRKPVGHYRVPQYLRGKVGLIDRLIPVRSVNNEEEGFGRNAGEKRRYYRVAFPLSEIWEDYAGGTTDKLFIEVFETWLEATSL